jgi:hypothetical protein
MHKKDNSGMTSRRKREDAAAAAPVVAAATVGTITVLTPNVTDGMRGGQRGGGSSSVYGIASSVHITPDCIHGNFRESQLLEDVAVLVALVLFYDD